MKNKLFISGTIAFFILAGLVWNYTETIKAKNFQLTKREVEKKFEQQLKDVDYARCIRSAQAQYDVLIDHGVNGLDDNILLEQMKSAKEDCDRLYRSN